MPQQQCFNGRRRLLHIRLDVEGEDLLADKNDGMGHIILKLCFAVVFCSNCPRDPV